MRNSIFHYAENEEERAEWRDYPKGQFHCHHEGRKAVEREGWTEECSYCGINLPSQSLSVCRMVTVPVAGGGGLVGPPSEWMTDGERSL